MPFVKLYLLFRLLYLTIFAILSLWEIREHLAAILQTIRRGGAYMVIAYSDFVQTGIFIVTLIGLCYKVFREKK